MEIEQLSVSAVESFDHSQKAGCNRRWWFERVQGLRPEETPGKEDGKAGHALLAHYFRTGESPAGRVKMGKAVTGAIIKGKLPKPGPDMLVEFRFDGQEQYDAAGNWIPLDHSKTFWLGGLPWDGFIDLAYRRGDVPTILDHKFKSDISDILEPHQLIQTVQLPIYVLSQLPRWPDAKQWEIVHHYVSRKGVESKIRSSVVSLDAVLERKASIEKTVEEMKLAALETSERVLPFNRKACEAFGGCPHQSICSAYRERNLIPMTDAEKELFADIPGIEEPETALAVAVLPPDAPASKPELAAEQAPEPKKKLAAKTKQVELPLPAPSAANASPAARVAVAELLESVAKLLRAG